MEVLKRTGIATFVVALALLAFVSLSGPRTAQAAGPYGGYNTTCIQTQVVYSWQWQWTGWSWQWVSVPSTVCTQYATFYYQQPVYTPQFYQQQFYTPVNGCLRWLPGGGYYNACNLNTNPYPYYGVGYWW